MKHINSWSDYLQRTQVRFEKMAHWNVQTQTVLNSQKYGSKWHEKVKNGMTWGRWNVSFAKRKEIDETGCLKKRMFE